MVMIKPKRILFYNGTFKIERKQTALHNNEKGHLHSKPYYISEEDYVSWRLALNWR